MFLVDVLYLCTLGALMSVAVPLLCWCWRQPSVKERQWARERKRLITKGGSPNGTGFVPGDQNSDNEAMMDRMLERVTELDVQELTSATKRMASAMQQDGVKHGEAFGPIRDIVSDLVPESMSASMSTAWTTVMDGMDNNPQFRTAIQGVIKSGTVNRDSFRTISRAVDTMQDSTQDDSRDSNSTRPETITQPPASGVVPPPGSKTAARQSAPTHSGGPPPGSKAAQRTAALSLSGVTSARNTLPAKPVNRACASASSVDEGVPPALGIVPVVAPPSPNGSAVQPSVVKLKSALKSPAATGAAFEGMGDMGAMMQSMLGMFGGIAKPAPTPKSASAGKPTPPSRRVGRSRVSKVRVTKAQPKAAAAADESDTCSSDSGEDYEPSAGITERDDGSVRQICDLASLESPIPVLAVPDSGAVDHEDDDEADLAALRD